MKKMMFPLLLLLAALCFNACTDKEPLLKPDYLIFGYGGYAWCGGDCFTSYKLSADQLLIDSNTVSLDTLLFQTTPLSADKHAIAVHLLNEIPSDMLTATTNTYTCHGCADQNFYFLEISQNGVVKRFYIDDNADDMPAYLADFVTDIRQTMTALQ